jgi:transcriptional regulator GlxA family with amidase domain
MIVCIPVYENVNLLDVTGPVEFFSWAGLDVELVAERAGPIVFRSGIVVQVASTFHDVETPDVLWVPGGEPDALTKIMNDPESAYLQFLRDKSGTARYVASVCEGAMLLAAAGLLDGYEATTHWQFLPCFEKYFPNVTAVPGHPRFHLDRNRLTGGGVSSGLDESLQLIKLLLGEERAKQVQQGTQYYPKPPVDSEIPEPGACPLILPAPTGSTSPKTA